MKKVIDKTVIENDFNQKKINHIVHYLDNFEFLIKILRDGFAPSYCLERIDNFDYYIPMVSFCNIPFKDVDQYMRYGKYGIGTSLEWACKNEISPVIYVHDNTPFKDLHSKLNKLHLMRMAKEMFHFHLDNALNGKNEEADIIEYERLFKDVSDITVPATQFFKNWKTTYKGKEIITYHEREWRYIPKLETERLLSSDDFKELKKTRFKSKPHLKEYTLQFSSLSDLRYVLINNDSQRQKVLNVLEKKFGKELVVNAILAGALMIINDELIRNDF